MLNNYDRVASFYDSLSQLVFGRALIEVQEKLLAHIPANSRILIVGGGTGWVLETISNLHPSGLQITYIEISAQMLERSRKRNYGQNQVTFVHSALEDYPLHHTYDVIFTAFLFDNFVQERIDRVMQRLDACLQPAGIWLFADFHLSSNHPRFWQKYLHQIMLLFFRLLCRVEATTLVPMHPIFTSYGYAITHRYNAFGSFVIGLVYRRKG
ncbi:class I SAM-dependent methyltransferase [Dyadobacter tibetensis]|uniref:class I SAM-dependent methyltransferase n=1 Tax=Dyadobacter tibetensis TaxID=1211851 RepID=UPI0004703150|nr:class I SAM-dependent methyltransferase [Dyadobacter tibetensis]